ncbi:sterol desaturase family protein [Cyclobacteriaceae bacterium]|nr:sterol desaturase family protein [Cyclobacteriaceae bacterium]
MSKNIYFTWMEAYVGVLNYAIPFFLILIFFEAWIGHVRGEKVVRSMDTLASLISGVTNVFKDVLGLTVIIVSYDWMVDNLSLIQIEKTWVIYLVAFIGLDFSGYWVHRISHKINYFWNHHLVHHSSEEFNLGCALRQSISKWFSISFVFLLPTALLGVPAQVVAFIAPLHLFSQYWYHTKLIGKLGFLEYVLVTPSHHRVHHAINDIYIDKNLSQIFIFWDKIFGTFQVELANEPPVYGVKKVGQELEPFCD